MLSFKRLMSGLLVVACIVASLAIAGCGVGQAGGGAPLTVKVLDVGQGDAIFIRTPEQTVLIDTGDIPARDKLLAHLRNQGISALDKVIITHPHADHLGGMPGLLETFTVKQIFDSGQTTTSGLYRQYLGAVQKKNIPFKVVTAGELIDLGGGVTLKVLAPGKPFITGSDSDLNNNSIVTQLVFGGFSMLLAADAEQPAEDRMLKKYSSGLNSTILKSGHHGSRTSSSMPFLRAVNPEVAIISAGVNNEYHHPHPATLKKYADRKIKVYRTDTDGTVTITSDGKSYQISKEK
ncbi:MAG TPA: ComEC/Rec2 family competence protein [Methylomusa anaerophila]|uniref:ComEC family competence protein n=1 Tax=Methylomusa anaerophila TaxID=1930071 RepID=A0A348AMJ6_9FIRM|nr:ComEC/Rec2 family competence protein [Methylomusa anaerophila]BBB92294.1 ComEC family competence protein [Methylomusa anaerophila]HML90245.1 ComEC/Rec2 family competence protein [Methylomusa anaerophila]